MIRILAFFVPPLAVYMCGGRLAAVLNGLVYVLAVSSWPPVWLLWFLAFAHALYVVDRRARVEAAQAATGVPAKYAASGSEGVYVVAVAVLIFVLAVVWAVVKPAVWPDAPTAQERSAAPERAVPTLTLDNRGLNP